MKDKTDFSYWQVFSGVSILSVSRLFPVELFILTSHCIIWISCYLPFLSLFFQFFKVPSTFFTMCPLFSLLLSPFISNSQFHSLFIWDRFYILSCKAHISCIFIMYVLFQVTQFKSNNFAMWQQKLLSQGTQCRWSWVGFRVSSGIACIHRQAFKGLFWSPITSSVIFGLSASYSSRKLISK